VAAEQEQMEPRVMAGCTGRILSHRQVGAIRRNGAGEGEDLQVSAGPLAAPGSWTGEDGQRQRQQCRQVKRTRAEGRGVVKLTGGFCVLVSLLVVSGEGSRPPCAQPFPPIGAQTTRPAPSAILPPTTSSAAPPGPAQPAATSSPGAAPLAAAPGSRSASSAAAGEPSRPRRKGCWFCCWS
jgi:hypothetical protein